VTQTSAAAGRPAEITTSERYYVIKPQLIQQRSGIAILLPVGKANNSPPLWKGFSGSWYHFVRDPVGM
jgi:hypothetical protein